MRFFGCAHVPHDLRSLSRGRSSSAGSLFSQEDWVDDVALRGRFIRQSAGSFRAAYDAEQTAIGRGGGGVVRKATHKVTGSRRAVKSISKKGADADVPRREVTVMMAVDHPNIPRLFETFEDRTHVHLVLDFCSGGQLLSHVSKSGPLSEAEASAVMRQVFRPLHYLHGQLLCHRDVKPDNLMFATDGPVEQRLVKIVDFGLACRVYPDKPLRAKVGSVYYVAPEVLDGRYNQLCDEWSAGVLMFVLLSRQRPFNGKTPREVGQRVRAGHVSFRGWPSVPDETRDLILSLLETHRKSRLTAGQALEHGWFQRPPAPPNLSHLASLVGSLQGFTLESRLKRAALHAIAQQQDEDQISALREAFMALDVNSDGVITPTELSDGLSKAGCDDVLPDVKSIVAAVDADGNGTIEYTEFLAATLNEDQYLQNRALLGAFCAFDKDGNGKISREELEEVLGEDDGLSDDLRTVIEIISEVDENGDGEIDFDEFTHMMRGHRRAVPLAGANGGPL